MRNKILFFLMGLVVLLLCAICFLIYRTPKVEVKNFGVTFSKLQALDLGLDWQESYKAIFEDLGFDSVRVPVYWSEIETKEGIFDYSSLDWMLDIAGDYNAKVILVIGRKVPRWPECHEPQWAKDKEIDLRNASLLSFMETTIKRYDGNSIVWAWQVENEPFLNFGECPKFEDVFLDKEIALVKSLSKKPVVVTDSGEISTWFDAYKRGDIFGTTLYRTVWSDSFGYIKYPLPPSFFRLKKGLVKTFFGEKPSVVIELQAEPWGPMLIQDLIVEEQLVSMNPEKFVELMEYIEGTGFDTFYLWGVEWWYYLKENGHPEMWDLVQSQILNLKSKNL
ncbi:MAG: beta-galactosidase [Candidatus Marinimicrobia bacterium]|nr:beta-galactosidase [Candidatus Neomarinimicrobiota bacterium]